MAEGAIEQAAALDLDALLAPWGIEALRAMLRIRTPQHVRGGDPNRFSALLDWDGLLELVLSGAYPASKLHVTRGGVTVPPVFHRDGDKPNVAAIERLMASGGSLVLYGFDPFAPRATQACGAMAEALGEKVIVSAVATTGSGGALDPHFDKGDVLVLQVEGRKRWVLRADPVPEAIPGMSGALPEPAAPTLVDVILEPGDLFFVPAGYIHHCENCSERSLHLAFLIYPLTAPRVIELLFRAMMEDPAARRAFRELADDPAAHEAALREAVVARLHGIAFDDLVARHRATDYLTLGGD